MRTVDTAKLRYYMEKSSVKTAGSLAEKSGVNRNTIQGVLNGSVLPSSEVMDKIIMSLSIPLSEAGGIFFAEKLASDARNEVI